MQLAARCGGRDSQAQSLVNGAGAKDLAPQAGGDIVGAVLTPKWRKILSRWLCLLAWVFGQTNSIANLKAAGSVLQTGAATTQVVTTSYDALNRPVAIVDDNATAAADDKTTSYGYDLAGRAVRLVNGIGQRTENTYDDAGRLKRRQVFGAAGAQMVEFNWNYDEKGHMVWQQEVWTKPGARTRTTSLVYDHMNRLALETVVEAAGTNSGTWQTGYTYDAASNRKTKSVSYSGTPALAATETQQRMGYWQYNYNAGNQLISWTKKTGLNGTVQRSVTLEYDGYGNRKKQVIVNTGISNSDSLRAGTTNYFWDGQDRLAQATFGGETFKWQYDYRTRRIGLTSPAVTGTAAGVATDQPGVALGHVAFIFSGGLSVAEHQRTAELTPLDATADVAFVRGPDMGGGVGGLLYSKRGGVFKYDVSNGRGDIVAQSNPGLANGANDFTWAASYETAGKRAKTTGTGTNADRQRGNSKDEETRLGLLNEGFRYRDTETMVWLSRDPAGFVDGPNLYAYVRQNPWSKFDPKGLAEKNTATPAQAAPSSLNRRHSMPPKGPAIRLRHLLPLKWHWRSPHKKLRTK